MVAGPPLRTEPSDQRVFQSTIGGRGLATSGQMRAQQFTGVAVDHQGQTRPTVTTRPGAVQVCRPALIG